MHSGMILEPLTRLQSAENVYRSLMKQLFIHIWGRKRIWDCFMYMTIKIMFNSLAWSERQAIWKNRVWAAQIFSIQETMHLEWLGRRITDGCSLDKFWIVPSGLSRIPQGVWCTWSKYGDLSQHSHLTARTRSNGNISRAPESAITPSVPWGTERKPPPAHTSVWEDQKMNQTTNQELTAEKHQQHTNDHRSQSLARTHLSKNTRPGWQPDRVSQK